jgi:hypothetical protein
VRNSCASNLKDASALCDQLLGDWARKYGEVEISLHGPAGAG